MDLIEKVREKQNEMILMVNSIFDEIIKDMTKLEKDTEVKNEYETIYPLTSPKIFKGKRTVAVLIGGNRYLVPTWKKAFEVILKDAIKDQNRKKKMEKLCNHLLGHKRNRLSNNPNDMRSPIKIADNLYVETHYDVETLMNLLLQILNEIGYDYSNINIAVRN